MHVRRITANLHAPDPAALARFYSDVFQLGTLMDLGWIAALGAERQQAASLQLASEGGSGTPLPCLSIEVDDLDQAHANATAAGADITYGPVTEPWGVRRFYFRDPAGNLINVATHTHEA